MTKPIYIESEYSATVLCGYLEVWHVKWGAGATSCNFEFPHLHDFHMLTGLSVDTRARKANKSYNEWLSSGGPKERKDKKSAVEVFPAKKLLQGALT
jgi:hypothetical protein